MNPLLTDDAVAELPLHHGRSELLDEILRTPVAAAPLLGGRDRRRRPWVAPVAAAAAVVLLAVGVGWTADHVLRESAPSVATQPPAPDAFRVLLDQPGWTVSSVVQDEDLGGIGYENADATLKLDWYPAAGYEDRLAHRREEAASDGTAVEIAGLTGSMWSSAANDHTALRPVEGGHFLEVRGFGMDEAAFASLLSRMQMVDAAQFDAALPPGYVRDGQRGSRVQVILDGIALHADPLLPGGHDRSEITSDQSDPYQLGSDVAGQVACDWVAEYDAARQAGDQARAQQAVDVMSTSRQWPVLREIADQGDTPEWIWAMADQMAAGQVPPGYLPSCRDMGALP